MNSLFRKELNTFFGSITGYLVIAIFLLTTSLFLWVFPGVNNVIEGQNASLKSFFDLAPWLYLFLIPAITMRMFAEEKRMGTMEMLITRPITSWQIVVAKYLAAMLLVLISILPTLLYFYSVYKLGNPVGNIDTGATWGSYLGLFMLASVYISIGLFASSITTNQVISFLVAIVLAFIAYTGFDFIAAAGLPLAIQNILILFGIQEHYLSISRGVIDSRDIMYFFAASLLFLAFTQQQISIAKLFKQLKIKKILILTTLAIFVVLGIHQRVFRIDLTAEKRYSLNTITKQLLQKQKHPISVELYLNGKLPAGLNDFRNAIIEKTEDLNAYSSQRIFIKAVDIYKIEDNKKRNKTIENLINAGIEPINLGHKTTEGLSTKQIFPGVILKSNNKILTINLLNNNSMLSAEENIKQSVELLEYEFARALKKLQQNEKLRIAFLDKPGNASIYETSDLRFALSENYEVGDIKAAGLSASDSVHTLIVAAPTQKFTEEEKIQIDQFAMNGGRILWCIDPVYVSIDSLSKGFSTLAFEKGLNLRDQLFRYGIRINPDILQDAFCLEYPINTAPHGQAAKFTPAPFYYSPLALPNPNHQLSRNLNNVMLEFASSIDPVAQNNTNITPILATSPYARSVNTPAEVSLYTATNPPDKRLFNQPNIPIGMLIEGDFESAFKNRITSNLNFENIKEQCTNNKMIVIADGDIIKNDVRNRNGNVQIQPLGYDKYSEQIFGNKDFLVNCINYLTDDQGIMSIRSNVIKMRLLDKVKIRDQKIYWQIINTMSPIAFFVLFAIVFSILRKRKYCKK